jgi:hypothetical protein
MLMIVVVVMVVVVVVVCHATNISENARDVPSSGDGEGQP